MADMIRAEDIRRIIADKDRREPGEGAIPEPLSPREPLTKPPVQPPLREASRSKPQRAPKQPEPARGGTSTGAFLYSKPPDRPPVLPPMPPPGAPDDTGRQTSSTPPPATSAEMRPPSPFGQPMTRPPVMPPLAPPGGMSQSEARRASQQGKAPAPAKAASQAAAQSRPMPAKPPVKPPAAPPPVAARPPVAAPPQAVQSPLEGRAAEQPTQRAAQAPQAHPQPSAPVAPPRPTPAEDESWVPPALKRVQEELPPDAVEQWDLPPEVEDPAPDHGYDEAAAEQSPAPSEPDDRDATFDEWNDPPGESLTERLPAWDAQPWPADDETQSAQYQAPPLYLPGEEEYEYEEAAPSRRRRWFLPITIAILALIGFAAVLLYGFGSDDLVPSVQAPTLQAQSEVDKVRPDEPGGLQVPNRNVEVLNQETPAAEPEAVVLQPPPEEPAPLPSTSRVTITPPAGNEASFGTGSAPLGGVTITPPPAQDPETGFETSVSERTPAASEPPPADAPESAGSPENASAPADAASDATEPTETQVAATETPPVETPTPADATTEAPAETAGSETPAPTEEAPETTPQVAGDTQTAAAPPAESDGATSAAPDAAAQTEADSGTPSRLAAPGLAIPPRPSAKLDGSEASVASALQAIAPPVEQSPPPQPAAAEPNQPEASTAGTSSAATQAPQDAPAPDESEAPEQAAAAEEPPTFVIQLASLTSASAAETSWEKINGEHGDLLSGLTPAVQKREIEGRGTFYRLRAGPLTSRRAADQLCERLKDAGQACIVIGP